MSLLNGPRVIVLISNHCHEARDLRAIPVKTWRQLTDKLERDILGKPLQRQLKGLWSIRISDYRAVYERRDEYAIIIAVDHRKDAYSDEQLARRRTD